MSEPLHCIEIGAAEAAPIVFLHGFGAAAFVWFDLQQGFAGERPSLAYDLPGHGQSLQADGCARHGHWIGGESPLRGELVATVSRRQLHVD